MREIIIVSYGCFVVACLFSWALSYARSSEDRKRMKSMARKVGPRRVPQLRRS